MQIKQENGQIKLIRYVYISEKKRTVNRQIGKFPSYETEAPGELLELLNDAEKAELEEFLAAKRASYEEARKRNAVRDLPTALNNAADAIRDGDGGALLYSQRYIDQLLDGLDKLKKELRKKEIKITRGPKNKKKSAHSNDDQSDLLK